MINLPLLADLVEEIINDLQSAYGVNISEDQQSALRAIGETEAGQQWLQYKVLGFLQRQVWPDIADPEAQGGTLERFGRVRLNRNPFPAVAGVYTATITGTNGAILPGQTTIFKSDDTALSPGYLFVLDNTFTMTGTTNTITLRALTPGIISKLAVNNTLTITSPIALVGNSATVASVTTQPLASETIEEYRTEILTSFQLEATGGSASDYRIWAQDAQGEKQVYVYTNPAQVNSNNIYVEANISDSTDGKGTPSQAILNAVRDVVNFNPATGRARRPNTVINYYLPITPLNVDITITGGTFTTSQKTSILNALTTAINTVRPFVAASDSLSSKNDTLDTNKINGVIYSAVPGAVYTGVTLKVNNSTVLSYVFSLGNIPFFNSLTYL